MWFKVEQKRSSVGQKYVVRCNSEIAGKPVVEERSAKGTTEARKTAEILASTLNVTATVYGTDADGEFVHGVYEVSEGAAVATSPLIRRLFAESAAASLTLKDQLLADIPEDTIKGFATMSAALGYIVAQHKQIKRAATPQIGYSTLFRIFCGSSDANTLSLSTNDATIAILTRKLSDLPGWMWLSELPGLGSAERSAVIPAWRANKVTLTIDGELQVIRPRTVFRGTVPETGAQFMLVVQMGERRLGQAPLDSVGLVYREEDESAVVATVRQLLLESNPFKDRVVLINRDLRTVRSKMSDRSWNDVVPHEHVRAELDFIAASIRNREMLKAEGLTIKRGLLLSGPPGDGKSTAIECFVNDIAGEATVLIVEAVEHIRAVYHLAQTLAPAVVILEDLDLMTKSRQNPYSYAATSKDDLTGELLQVLSGGSAYDDIVTIATTNHPEAIDEALAKRAGRFDAHIRMGYPSEADKQRILDLYLDRFGVNDELTRRRLQQTLSRDLGRLHLVPAHIEEFVKAGIKRARLAHRPPEYLDFEPGIEATKSIATQKPAAS
ncbi:ATP-binding protein [Bradyrhizobium sp. 41S5]|uniref:ATP-binding protein n=1 Tax=Bradyrhizobium sp. 41S5 TaxID=1404443 RepID=UPI00156AD77F|nr:ATP-binding protein [Bradyrhizobium sp. 41S5]UFX45966.1 ATP-binding protein [Bradyrhizobium sp. 41S5]